MTLITETKEYILENKEGILVGALIGFIIAKFFFPQDIDITLIAQTQSIVDVFKSTGTTAIEFAKTKVMLGLIVISAFIGMILDSLLKEGWWK